MEQQNVIQALTGLDPDVYTQKINQVCIEIAKWADQHRGVFVDVIGQGIGKSPDFHEDPYKRVGLITIVSVAFPKDHQNDEIEGFVKGLLSGDEAAPVKFADQNVLYHVAPMNLNAIDSDGNLALGPELEPFITSVGELGVSPGKAPDTSVFSRVKKSNALSQQTYAQNWEKVYEVVVGISAIRQDYAVTLEDYITLTSN